MRPLIGLSCSTLVSAERDEPGLKRFGLAAFYVQRVEEAGGLPVVLPTLAPERAEEVLQRVDGLLLSGGADVDPDLYGAAPHPRLGPVDRPRDLFEIALLRAARRAGLPVLAICRGMQVANVAFGGTLIQDLPSQRPDALGHDQRTLELTQTSHPLRLEPGTLLSDWAGATTARVNSYHHQAVDRLAEGFRITARTPDGLIEGMEQPEGAFFQCVQWHPERLAGDALTRLLFQRFVEASRPLHQASPSEPEAAPSRRAQKAAGKR